MVRLNRWRTTCVALVFCGSAAIAARGQLQFNTIFSFNGTDGVAPHYMFLIQGTDGNFYGTTEQGGANGAGTVFRITPQGTQTVLYNFCKIGSPPNCTDGAGPFAGLVQATDGNFYGTTGTGGINSSFYSDGAGTVFKITPSGTLTTLYSFCSQANCADGALPAGLVQGSDGNLYGTTVNGGAYNFGFGGTVFAVTLGGTLTTLYSFCSETLCADGESPSAGGGALVAGSDGNFYGTTYIGGTEQDGTVFKITPTGTETVLYSFCLHRGCADGQEPGGLTQGPDGNFYGTTELGGVRGNGTVFRITPTGVLDSIYSFCPNRNQRCFGAEPVVGLTVASNGDFAGTTSLSSTAAVFGISPKGKFEQFTHADNTSAGLLQGTNGLFYGMAYGGSFKQGTIFSLGVGLGPFVKTSPTFGQVGESVIILGTNLTGATSVTFNGTEATFSVVSGSEITTKVPTGASTGSVKVATPSGTLTSNLPFDLAQ